MFDYEMLRLIWWALLGVLLVGFAIMDGFDLGVAMLFRFLGRNDNERRVLLEAIEPVWEGNQVWFILGGGAIFAAWPILYATSFSGFYMAMFLVLLALILRPVSFVFRGKLAGTTWRNTWDWTLFVSGLVPSLVFGVAFGNYLLGVPFHFDETLRMTYEGGFFELLNPFAVLCGLVSIAMLLLHGATYAALKTESPINERAVTTARGAAIAFIVLFTIAGIWLSARVPGYRITSVVDPNAASNPLNKQVILAAGAWLENYDRYPWMLLAPALAYVGAMFAFGTVKRMPGAAFIGSAMTAAMTICTAGFSAFPFLLPSSSSPNSSLTVWDASSSQGTLLNMLIAAVIFVPIILIYTSWVFRVLRGKVSIKDLHDGAY
ncbi:MAG: cytochrome d ubiquinol oxidase subunit II [Steroidobacteraceae bacterium]